MPERVSPYCAGDEFGVLIAAACDTGVARSDGTAA